MAGGIQKSNVCVQPMQHCLFGKYGDSPLLLHGIRIKKGIFVIHSSHRADSPGLVQQALRQRCLSRVYMGKNSKADILFWGIFFILQNFVHGKCPFLSHVFGRSRFLFSFHIQF